LEEEFLKTVGLIEKEDGLYWLPGIGGEKSPDEVYQDFLRVGVMNVSSALIAETLEKTEGGRELVKIADGVEGYDTFKDDYIRVFVSRDGLEAYLDVTYPGTGENIAVPDILHKVYEADVKYNVDYDKIQRIVKNKIFAEHEIVATGREPIYGDPAQITYEVDTDISQEPLIMDDGSVDFRQVNLLKTVEKEQLLAIKIPPTKGTDGTDVRGNVIDSTGKEAILPGGKNTYISEDGLSLYAAVNGRIMFEKEKYQVENILAIEGDVDFSTGNIDFNGDIAVGGDVLTGFKVRAEGDIRIKGTVEGAEIISTKGSVIISRGIVGQEKAKVYANQDVKAEFINEATVEAGHDVDIGEYIINSNVNAGQDVRALEGRGMVIGGKIYADRAVEAKVAGSPNNVKTELRVGGKIDKEIYEKMLYIEKDLEVLDKHHRATRKEIEFIELLKKKLPKFPEKKIQEMKAMILKLRQIEQKIVETEEKKKAMEDEYGGNVSEDLKKIVVNTLHRGVTVGIDQSKLLAEYTYKLVLIQSKDGEMKINYKSRYV
jgi:uncharacterized protein